MKNNSYNILLISGSGLIGGLLNYIYHPIMLQYLTIEEFGEFGSLVGLFAILSVFTSGIHVFLTKEVSEHMSDLPRVRGIFSLAFRYLSLIGGGLFLLFLVFSSLIADYLSIHLFPVMIVGTVILTSFLGVSLSAILTGLRKFGYIGFNTIFHPLLKILIGVSCVALGYGMIGALGGFVLSGVMSLGITAFYLTRVFSGVSLVEGRGEVFHDFRKQKMSLIQFIFMSISFSILMNADVMIARNIFAPDIAGAYAGVSIVGKFLLFLLLSVETVYYGQIIEKGKGHIPFSLLVNALLIMFGLALIALIANLFVGEYILSLLSPGLESYSSVYIILIGYYGLLAFVSILSKILIAWEVYGVNVLLTLLALIFVVFSYLFGSGDLVDFALTLLSTLIVGTLTLATFFAYHLFRKRH